MTTNGRPAIWLNESVRAIARSGEDFPAVARIEGDFLFEKLAFLDGLGHNAVDDRGILRHSLRRNRRGSGIEMTRRNLHTLRIDEPEVRSVTLRARIDS